MMSRRSKTAPSDAGTRAALSELEHWMSLMEESLKRGPRTTVFLKLQKDAKKSTPWLYNAVGQLKARARELDKAALRERARMNSMGIDVKSSSEEATDDTSSSSSLYDEYGPRLLLDTGGRPSIRPLKKRVSPQRKRLIRSLNKLKNPQQVPSELYLGSVSNNKNIYT
jgi:hypothetical protein